MLNCDLQPQTKASINRTYTFRERRAGSRDRVGFSSKDVIYLATPDRFANGDTSRMIL